ncbi:hypothetical protein C8F04DRAFT_1156188 [Mycena alexandri]|uniref:Uncharacterized protein n=1 Tax=Mycena alexandri TaxID=1745969 RepID=A0AAD6WLY1_9AGAR|nr:hypothetical protein C8F04DRAFT_1156188 [Mycena alexandri]
MEQPIETSPVYPPPPATPSKIELDPPLPPTSTYQPSRQQYSWAENDGTVGPLLPRIQEVYHLGYLIVSLLFVCASIGSITGAVVTISLTQRFGFGKVMSALKSGKNFRARNARTRAFRGCPSVKSDGRSTATSGEMGEMGELGERREV